MADSQELEPQFKASEIAIQTAENRIAVVDTAPELLDVAYNAMLRNRDNNAQKVA